MKKPNKRSRARPPIAFRTKGMELSQALRNHTRTHLGMKLGKFAPNVARVTIRISKVHGPNGIEKICRANAMLVARPTVIVEQRDHDVYAAVDTALDRLERAVNTSLKKRRQNGRVRARKAAARARDRGANRSSLR